MLSRPQDPVIPPRVNSRASGHSRNGSSMSRSQSLIKKNIQLQDLKPADVLIERFVAWKAIVQQLTAYFEGIADIETNIAKELTKLAGVIQLPFRAGNQFLGEGGLQDVFYDIRNKTRIIADQHADLGRTVDSSIVEHLQKLRTEVKAHIKNVQNDTGKLAASVAKERELSTRLVGELANDISTFKNTPMNIAAKSDPYVANQAVARQLQRQVLEENLLQKSIVMMQQNSAHFEEGIVRSIQSAWQTFDEWQSRASATSQEIFRTLSTHLASVAPDREWIQFAGRSDHLLDPDTPLRDPELISYPLKDDPSVFPVHTGHMERKKRFTRAYTESYFVLTPVGFLHEFATGDPNSPGGLVPTFSLFLPSCTLGPVSSSLTKNNKFHIEGRTDGLGTTKSKSGSFKGLLGRGDGADGSKSWSFRLKSREEMMEWWNDIKMLCARYLVASEQLERTGPVEAAVKSVGYATEEEEEEEEEEMVGEAIRGEEEVEGSSVEEEGEYQTYEETPPGYTVPEKHMRMGPGGSYLIDKKPIHYPVNGEQPIHQPQNVDDATVDPTSDEQPSARLSHRLSQRQMEKAPEGIRGPQPEYNHHVPADDLRLPSPHPQHVETRDLPPPLAYRTTTPPSPTPASRTAPRFVTKDNSDKAMNGAANGAVHGTAKTPAHVGGRHLSPPPHLDTEAEAATGDGDDMGDDEDDDMYTDDQDHLESTEHVAAGTKAETVPTVSTNGGPAVAADIQPQDGQEGYEHGIIDKTLQKEPTSDVSGDGTGVEANAPSSGGALAHGSTEVHAA